MDENIEKIKSQVLRSDWNSGDDGPNDDGSDDLEVVSDTWMEKQIVTEFRMQFDTNAYNESLVILLEKLVQHMKDNPALPILETIRWNHDSERTDDIMLRAIFSNSNMEDPAEVDPELSKLVNLNEKVW